MHQLYEFVDTDDPCVMGTLVSMSSLSIDLMMLYTLYTASKRKTYNVYLAITLFYLLRFTIQQLTTLPLPSNYKFHNYLHIPSIFVRYDVLGDLYPSGHASVPIFFLYSVSNTQLKQFAVF